MSKKFRKLPKWMSGQRAAVNNAISNIISTKQAEPLNQLAVNKFNEDDEPINKSRLRSNYQFPKSAEELKNLEPKFNIDDLPMVDYEGKVYYLSDYHDIAETSEKLIKIIESKPSDDVNNTVGVAFDMEWTFSFQTGPEKTSLIQVCVDIDECYLFHLPLLKKIPATLAAFLNHPRVRLHGVNIKNDLRKLERDFPIIKTERMIQNCIDLGVWYNQVFNSSGRWSMERLVLQTLRLRIDKSRNVRMSKWHILPLSGKQQKYAAIDVHIAQKIYYHILKKQKEDTENLQEFFTGYGAEKYKNILILTEHSPVYTIGIRTKNYTINDEEKLRKLGAEFYQTNRGGLITFHGIGQLVAYPIINLKNFQPSVRWYVCQIEKTIIDLCKKHGIKAQTTEDTGVWVENRKICAIGIHASRYITTHGLALNCNVDLSWFDHIVPCGIEGKEVTSLSKELSKNVTIDETEPEFLSSFQNTFQCSIEVIKPSETREILDNLKTLP
ncbi:CLUMA_CG002570, isoform A [Clunio marinus]|uniref:lipoyl(octanoyl) transferase n=1 Tax=Clunio marinus TaxID=568069 RepID=A0A1J1HRK0_9DIPT|nr:CLUMA_CG002570, isoform A [Clunio marinus]